MKIGEERKRQTKIFAGWKRKFPLRPANVATLASGSGSLFLTGSIFKMQI